MLYLPFFNCKLTPTQLVKIKYKTKIMKRNDVQLKVLLLVLLLQVVIEICVVEAVTAVLIFGVHDDVVVLVVMVVGLLRVLWCL